MRFVSGAGAGLVAWAALVPVAHAEPVTIWLTDQLPEERVREKADLQTGGTLHLVQDDLRYAPTPATPKDDEALAALDVAWDAARDRWDDFDVELAIAKDLDAAVAGVTLLRSEKERDELARLLLFQGAAVARAFDPEHFATDPLASGLRLAVPGEVGAVPMPWVRAWALTGEKAQRGDLVDGTGWLDWQRYGGAVTALKVGRLTVPAGVGDVWLDGVRVEPGEVPLRPGRHWLHVMRHGILSDRTVIDVAAGAEIALPTPVDAEELAAARARVLEGRHANLPDDVLEAIRRIEAHYGGPIYLGVVDGNKPVLVPLGAAEILEDDRLVTFVLFGELGGGLMGTPLFDQKATHESTVTLTGPDGASTGVVTGDTASALQLAGAAFGGLGAELGVSYFAAALGLDGAFTPGHSIDYVLEDAGERDADSGHVAVFPQPWIGVGAYALRPTKPGPTLSVMGTVGFMAPTHVAYGGRLTVGIPIDDAPTWFRLSVGGAYGPDTFRDLDGKQPLFTGWLRFGFGVRP